MNCFKMEIFTMINENFNANQENVYVENVILLLSLLRINWYIDADQTRGCSTDLKLNQDKLILFETCLRQFKKFEYMSETCKCLGGSEELELSGILSQICHLPQISLEFFQKARHGKCLEKSLNQIEILSQ